MIVAIIWDPDGERRVIFKDITSLKGSTEYFQKMTPQGATFSIKVSSAALVTTFKVDQSGEHASIVETK